MAAIKKTESTGISGWIRHNLSFILIPILSGALALFVAYGTSQRDNANLINRLGNAEKDMARLAVDIKDVNDSLEDLEQLLRAEIRRVDGRLSFEGRDLERKLTIVEIQVDNLRRRLSLFDGIPAPAPLFSSPGNSLSTSPDTVMEQ